MIADLLAAWFLEFCSVVAHLFLDAALIVAAMFVSGLAFVVARDSIRWAWRQARKQVKLSSERQQWAEFLAGHPDLIEVEDTPNE